jgi:L-aspartate oxidase
MDAKEKLKHIPICHEIPDWNAEGTVMNEEMILITQTMRELQGIMTNYVGIVRSNLRLRRAADRLSLLERETEELYKNSVLIDKICEVRNLVKVATLIVKMAIERKESRGLHFSIDYPKVGDKEVSAFSPED